MDVEWDDEKAKENLRKHRVDFADAATVLSDVMAITIPEEATDEERFVTLGIDALGDSWSLRTPGAATGPA